MTSVTEWKIKGRSQAEGVEQGKEEGKVTNFLRSSLENEFDLRNMNTV